MKPFKTAAIYAADLQQAYDYFKQGGENAALRFLTRYEQTLRTTMMPPHVPRLRLNGWRQIALPRSRYAIFYREAPEFWFLGGIISTVQDPAMIQAKLLIREISAGELPSE
jgi:hypothetical protein